MTVAGQEFVQAGETAAISNADLYLSENYDIGEMGNFVRALTIAETPPENKLPLTGDEPLKPSAGGCITANDIQASGSKSGYVESIEGGSKTGTVWDNITPTQENYPYTNIP